MSQKWIPQDPSLLSGLSDVTITSPTNGDILAYNGSKWINRPTIPATAGVDSVGGKSGIITLSTGLSMVGQVLTVTFPPAGVTSVSNIDTTLTIFPTVGVVIASLNLTKANTWTGTPTLSAVPILFTGAGTPPNASTGIGNDGTGNMTINVPTSFNISFAVNGAIALNINAGNLYPQVDNTISLGTAGYTWSGTYSQSYYSYAGTPFYLSNGKVVSIVLTAQTVAANTLTIPNFAGGNDTFAFLNLAQTFIGTKTFYSSGLKLNNPANTFAYTFVGAALTASYNITLPLLTASDTMAVLGFAQTFTAAQTFYSSGLLINNPANTFAYTIVGAALAASHNLNLPLITADDTIAVLGFAQTWTGIQTFYSSGILVNNPANTFAYTIVSAALAASHNLNLPLITGTDTLAVLGLAQTFSAAISFTLAIAKVANVTLGGVFGVASVTANASETLLTTTNPTSIVTVTPGTAGNYQLMVYFRVITGATTVTLTATYTDVTGSQTYTWVNAVSEIVGSYTLLPLFINSTTSAITVTATAGTANQVYVSADIIGF